MDYIIFRDCLFETLFSDELFSLLLFCPIGDRDAFIRDIFRFDILESETE